MQTSASLIADGKAKSAGSQSSFGCYLSSLSDSNNAPYAFWSVYLHYPEVIVSDAGEAKAAYKYRLKDDDGKIYLLANCVIPATREAASMVDDLLRESIRMYEKSNITQGTMTASLQKSSNPFCDLPNSEGFSCSPGKCWYSLNMNTCCETDPLTGEYINCGTAEVEVVAEIDDCTDCGDGGGGSLPPPDDPDDPWLPPPNGGGGGACTTCNPGDNPDGDDESCPLGTIADENGGCIGEEDPKPCVGNPVKNPRIAPQANSGIEGGRFRAGARKKFNNQGILVDKPHWATDLANNKGDMIHSLYDGTLFATGYDESGWGHFVIIKSIVDGIEYYFLYAHLQQSDFNFDQVSAGFPIGIASDSGNLSQAISDSLAVQHVHLEVRKVVAGVSFNSSPKLDPEDFLTTKFDSFGNPITSTDC
ncbi:M23 family metallopeptidase [Rhodohalobacter sp. 8-1]|uniref:M23 family metallopeptidase n=1 Tax=Rhodohalobacter sp. 8-1 TaxID=3131972 RepID=UPI0030EF497C